jgi:hypothetical protein
MAFQSPTIVKLAERMLKEIEIAVRGLLALPQVSARRHVCAIGR